MMAHERAYACGVHFIQFRLGRSSRIVSQIANRHKFRLQNLTQIQWARMEGEISYPEKIELVLLHRLNGKNNNLFSVRLLPALLNRLHMRIFRIENPKTEFLPLIRNSLICSPQFDDLFYALNDEMKKRKTQPMMYGADVKYSIRSTGKGVLFL